MTNSEFDMDLDGHERQDTRQFTGAKSVAKVNPYCAICSSAWPCPTAAQLISNSAEQGHPRPGE